MKLFNIIDTSFNRFDNTVRKYLQKTFGDLGMNYTHNQIFGVIFDGIKGIMQNAMFYIEDALTEQNIYTATRKKSVYNLAKISGYNAYYGSAASGTLLGNTAVTNTESSVATKIFIPDGCTVINNKTGLYYTIILPTDDYVFDISKPLVTQEFKIVQGQWQTINYVGLGGNFETKQITLSGLYDSQYVKVYVNGEEYYQAASIYDMSENSKEYVISTGYDSTFEVMFGNNNYGKAIEEGDNITIKYIEHGGELGNISDYTSAEMKFYSPCYDIYGNTIDGNENISLTLNAPVSGGTDEDSIDIVKKMIGYNSRSLVIASEDNFKLFLKRFSFIGYSNIFTEQNSLNINASCLANISDKITDADDYLNINTKDLLLTDNQKEMIITTLSNSNKTFAGITFNFIDPIIRQYSINCYAKIEDTTNRETAKMKIKQAIVDYFMNLPENTLFIPKSDIISKIIDEYGDIIKSFDFDFISELNENAYYNGFYTEYNQKLINGAYKYIENKKIYDSENIPGLDNFGNIQLTSLVEIPILHGGFNYYPNKEKSDKTTSIKTESIQILFI